MALFRLSSDVQFFGWETGRVHFIIIQSNVFVINALTPYNASEYGWCCSAIFSTTASIVVALSILGRVY